MDDAGCLQDTDYRTGRSNTRDNIDLNLNLTVCVVVTSDGGLDQPVVIAVTSSLDWIYFIGGLHEASETPITNTNR